MTAEVLAGMIEAVRRRAAERRRRLSGDELAGRCRPEPQRRRRFLAALNRPELALIAEFKRRSPSAGVLASADPGPVARSYAAGGAAAISILTEADHFGGSLTDLDAARPAGLPLLRKDFILDEWMILESHFFGADAVLLIAGCLSAPALGRLRLLAGELGMAVMVEVHHEAEVKQALNVEPDCVGVNARDLRTLHIDLATVERLLPLLPPGVVRVAESGIGGADDLRRVRHAGADAALVGEALLCSPQPAETLRSWTRAVSVAETPR